MTSIAANTPVLQTERLLLRAPTAKDLPAYAAFYAVSDLQVGGYRGNRSADEVKTILARDIAHWHDRGFGMFLMRARTGGSIFGGTGLSFPRNWPSHELTWWLMPKARGLGYATEASRAVIAWACRTLGWDHVETHMRDENHRARALARRLGGTVARRETFPDGVTRDVFVIDCEAVA